MRKAFLGLVVIISCLVAGAQSGRPGLLDSMKQQLTVVKTDGEKFDILSRLSKVYMTTNLAEADKYGQQLIEFAEGTRDRKLIVKALLANGERYSFLAGRKDNILKSIDYYNKALDVARRNKLESHIIKAYLGLSTIHRYLPDYDKSLAYCNQADSYMKNEDDDSLQAAVNLEFGAVYMGKNEKMLALRNFLSAVRLGEDMKNDIVRMSAYDGLASFYANINNFDTAIDLRVASLKLINSLPAPQRPYKKIEELNTIGDLYSYDKNFLMANSYYEKALAIADSVKYDPIKAMSYRSIIYNYLQADQPQKALDYFNAHPYLKDFLRQVNFGHFIDQSYGLIYMRMGKYDSAKYYYDKIAAFFEKDVNVGNQYNYYFQLGVLYSKTGETDKSLSYFLKANDLAGKMGSLDEMSAVAEKLDTLYKRKGDYKQALFYGDLHSTYKDSLQKLGREKELMQTEASEERRKLEKQIKEQEELKRRKNNIQYLGIIFGIVILFIMLAILGMFKVSAGLIKAIGFFVFLMLFEFIFLVFKKNIYAFTHGEPWKDLAFMIGLAALLVPLHHWLEHRVLHYLTSHNRLTTAGNRFKAFKSKIFSRSKKPA